MIVAIDGYEANVENRVGIGRYAFEIIKNIYLLRSAFSLETRDKSFRIYLPSKPLSDMPPETPWWQYRVIKPARLWTFIALPLALRIDHPRADVVFSPTHYIPRFTGIPKLMSIMDVSYLAYPELFRRKDLYQLQHWTRYAVTRAAKIVAISQFSKDAIIKAYHVPDSRVVVTYPGLTMTEISNSKYQIANIQNKFKIKKHYILSVGTLQPRKNFARLIEAFSLLKNDGGWEDVQLVIVGKKGWLYDDILAAPQHFSVADRVRFLDFVPDDDLPELYRNARCFALPSLYEGFGLPVLEAMAAGTQVVVSNTSSLPEVAGKAGIYVDPLDVDSIASGLKTALDEHGTKQWKDRILLGQKLAKQFTWENAAKKTLEILTEVGKGHI